MASPQFPRLIANETAFGGGRPRPGAGNLLLNAQILGFSRTPPSSGSREVLARYEQAVLVAFREAEMRWAAVRTSREQRDAQAQWGRCSRSVLRLANLRYKGRAGFIISMLVAQRTCSRGGAGTDRYPPAAIWSRWCSSPRSGWSPLIWRNSNRAGSRNARARSPQPPALTRPVTDDGVAGSLTFCQSATLP